MQYSMSRLSAFLLFFLSSLALLACASPVAAPASAVALSEHALVPRGTCLVCNTGTKTETILVKLKADIDVQLGLLDKCLETGEKPDGIIIKIEALINVAVAAIVKLDVDLLGLLNGRITIIVNLLVTILISVATHCGKWASKGAAEFEIFLQLCVKLDVALKALLSTCNGLGAVLLILIRVLINVSVLITVKFNLCIGLLGL
ncbi:unnamed protein product [Rhizoctonia solani]|uniref:Transmembrane protein n=3 Tax=Rhizoctonia solani TaxID=456999 RepID=A0A8H2WM10_9AGAM|nr:transmembrane protein, putative [Rhizoctonia solani AG-3 Rhs1AP]KEP47752.1 putative transmembrane protein [Rhizoctonia solani 123E]CAE6364424.1 unnamed protein product [Rhizoctonia solani]CAE6385367.1 unnamed protein product [Rhizoctonia solani]